jgi:hypothetical protein
MNIKLHISFICEQDGKIEREFKKNLSILLREGNKPLRAYLSQVKYGDSDDQFSVAVCYMLEAGAEDLNLVAKTSKLFQSMFGSHEHLDVVFLNDEQENCLRQVACPFYTAADFQITNPDFYLISSEGYGLNSPIACFKKMKLTGSNRDGYMLCDIQPPLIGQAYGMLSKDIFQLVFASRHQGYSLFPIKKWPAYVHVALTMKDNFNSFDIINDSDIINLMQ